MKNLKISNLFLLVLFSSIVSLLVSCEETTSVAQKEHLDAEGIIIKDATKAIYMKIFQGKIDTNYNRSFDVPINNISDAYEISFLDADGKIISNNDSDKKLNIAFTDTSIAEMYQHDGLQWEFHIKGKNEGTSTCEIQVLHQGHADFKTPKIPVIVRQICDESLIQKVNVVFEETEELKAVLEIGANSTGAITLNAGDTTDHHVFEFESKNKSVCPPNSLKYKLLLISSNPSNLEIIQSDPLMEPFAFQFHASKSGNYDVKVQLIENSTNKVFKDFGTLKIIVN